MERIILIWLDILACLLAITKQVVQDKGFAVSGTIIGNDYRRKIVRSDGHLPRY